MDINVYVQSLNDPPKLINIRRPILDMSEITSMTCCVVEEGMPSGEPSVLIVVERSNGGSIILPTSLNKFLDAGNTMATAARAWWGWQHRDLYGY